eukprot:7386065-Prymnesium_polylepis.1
MTRDPARFDLHSDHAFHVLRHIDDGIGQIDACNGRIDAVWMKPDDHRLQQQFHAQPHRQAGQGSLRLLVCWIGRAREGVRHVVVVEGDEEPQVVGLEPQLHRVRREFGVHMDKRDRCRGGRLLLCTGDDAHTHRNVDERFDQPHRQAGARLSIMVRGRVHCEALDTARFDTDHLREYRAEEHGIADDSVVCMELNRTLARSRNAHHSAQQAFAPLVSGRHAALTDRAHRLRLHEYLEGLVSGARNGQLDRRRIRMKGRDHIEGGTSWHHACRSTDAIQYRPELNLQVLFFVELNQHPPTRAAHAHQVVGQCKHCTAGAAGTVCQHVWMKQLLILIQADVHLIDFTLDLEPHLSAGRLPPVVAIGTLNIGESLSRPTVGHRFG